MEALFTAENGIALLTLAALEIVLGIDNLVVIAILSNKLPRHLRAKARTIGLALAMLMRVALLFSIKAIMGLTAPLVTVLGQAISGRDLVLLLGGGFLIYKATHEIHSQLEGETHAESASHKVGATFGGVIAQILMLDLVFSIDSVITAVGMAKDITVMVVAIVIAVISMMVFAGSLTRFINDHPTIKMLALSFLLLIGFTLVLEGFHKHIEKGYIYSAMGFSLIVELLNLKLSKKHVAKIHPVAPAEN